MKWMMGQIDIQYLIDQQFQIGRRLTGRSHRLAVSSPGQQQDQAGQQLVTVHFHGDFFFR